LREKRTKASAGTKRGPRAAGKEPTNASPAKAPARDAVPSAPPFSTGIEHIGIAVRDIDKTAASMRTILGARVLETIVSQERGLKLAFLDVSGTRVELLEPLTRDGTVAKFLETKGEGFHHIAFKVRDIQKTLSLLRQAGVKLVEPAPQKGAHGNLLAFIHPSSACGVLVELCERK